MLEATPSTSRHQSFVGSLASVARDTDTTDRLYQRDLDYCRVDAQSRQSEGGITAEVPGLILYGRMRPQRVVVFGIAAPNAASLSERPILCENRLFKMSHGSHNLYGVRSRRW